MRSYKLILYFFISISIQFSISCDTDPNTFTYKYFMRSKQIVMEVLESEDDIVQKVYQEFWNLIEKDGEIDEREVDKIRTELTGMISEYQKTLWQDALVAIKTKKPHCSQRRKETEKKYLKLKLITESRINANKEFINRIAQDGIIVKDGEELRLTEEIIEQLLRNIDIASERLDRLFLSPK